MEQFDFIGPNDVPALIAVTNEEARAQVKAALLEIGYKVHAVDTHPQFDTRYNQINYHVVVLEENFSGAATARENSSLQMIQRLSMSQRRHAVFFLIGKQFETLNALQAFTQSVHCVVHYSEMSMFPQLLQKTVSENNLFLTTFREIQQRVYQKTK